MAIKQIKIDDTVHDIQTTIANVDGLQAELDRKASSSHSLSKGTDSTSKKTLGFGETFAAITDTSVSGHEITDTTTTFTMPSDRLFTTLVPTGTAIPENADLNTATYMKVGRYYCSSNTTTKTLKNCPTTTYNSEGVGTNGTAFMMEVYSPLSTTIDNETSKTWIYRIRKLLGYTGTEYIQYCYVGATAGTWIYGDWNKSYQDKHFAANSTAPQGFKTGSVTIDGKTTNFYAPGLFYIEGGGTTDTTNKVATWTGTDNRITSYYNGLAILYKIGTAGSTTTTLNINDLGAVTVVKNATTAISTNFVVNSVILLVYTVDDGTAYWKAHDYDANTRNSVGDYRKNSTKLYLVGATTSDSSTSSSYATSYTNSNCYIGTDNRLYSNGAVVPNISEIEALIDDKLGVIENGSY